MMRIASSEMGRRAVLVLAATVTALVVSTGAALAVNQINCGSFEQDPLSPECFGTGQDDTIIGRAARDIIYAGGGTDHVDASGGDDEAYGGAGPDPLAGGSGDDELVGGKGADRIYDYAQEAQSDQDELRGGEGNDTLDAWDEDFEDTLVCGPGEADTATFDLESTTGRKDIVSDTCEIKKPSIKIAPRD